MNDYLRHKVSVDTIKVKQSVPTIDRTTSRRHLKERMLLAENLSPLGSQLSQPIIIHRP
jgi:hypothetical protein